MRHWIRHLHFLIACSLLFSRFSFLEAQELENQKKDEKWSPPTFSKVVGYRFDIPTSAEDTGYFSFLRQGLKEEAKALANLQRQKATLTAQQTKTLLSTLEPRQLYGFVACYTPHHIFIFYSATEEPVAAIEVCFRCRSVRTTPSIPKSHWDQQDLATLARLTEELGLWNSEPSANDWIKKFEAHLKGQ